MCDTTIIRKLAGEGFSWQQIADKLGLTKPTVIYLKKKHNIPTTFKYSNDKTFDKVFENGFILLDKREEVKTYCQCRFLCPKCNQEFLAIPSNLRRKSTTSCGCVKLGCRTGGKYITGEKFAAIKNRYKNRKMKFNITVEYIESLLEEQDFKCKLTGIKLTYDGYNKSFNASLDRIDSTIGYVKGNVQWIHKDVNLMKNNLDEQYFIELCNSVSKHQTKYSNCSSYNDNNS